MKLFAITLFALLLALCSRDAITTTPKGNSAPQKTGLHQMSHRPDLYIFTQVVPIENAASNTDGVVLLVGTLETMDKWAVALRNLKVLITPSGSGNSPQVASDYILLINHNVVQHLDSSSCDDFRECTPKGKAMPAVYTFNDIDCLIKKNGIIIVEIKAKIRNNQSGVPAKGNSLTAQLVWLGVEKTFIDASGNVIAEGGKRLFVD